VGAAAASAAAAAEEAQQAASIGCDSPHVAGTTSALVVQWDLQPGSVSVDGDPSSSSNSSASASASRSWRDWIADLQQQPVERKLASLRSHGCAAAAAAAAAGCWCSFVANDEGRRCLGLLQ
jgi:hypothetical protein